MNEFSQYAEYSVTKYKSPLTPLYRALFFISSVLISVITTIVLINIIGFEISVIIGLVLIIASVFLSIYVFRSTQYDYTVTEGEIRFSAITNKRSRKELDILNISNFEIIAPYNDKYREICDRQDYTSVCDYSSGNLSENLYFAVYPSEDDPKDKTLYLFEPSERIIILMKFYNRKTVI